MVEDVAPEVLVVLPLLPVAEVVVLVIVLEKQ
jgi:hypothetical protein